MKQKVEAYFSDQSSPSVVFHSLMKKAKYDCMESRGKMQSFDIHIVHVSYSGTDKISSFSSLVERDISLPYVIYRKSILIWP